MSKMYEALQYAYTQHELENTSRVSTPTFIKQELENKENIFPPILRTIPKNLPEVTDVQSPGMGPEMLYLKQSITALLPDSGKNIVQFISSAQGEGTSTILREFGKVLTNQHNKSVLLVDVNSQRPDQHRAFGLPTRVPLESIMKRGGAMDTAISRVKDSKISLCLLSEETALNSNSEWLAGDSRLIWEPIRKQFDFILVDSPATGASGDGLTICPTVDGVVIVVEAEKSRGPVVHSLKNRIIKGGGNILGIAFNKQRHYIPSWVYKLL